MSLRKAVGGSVYCLCVAPTDHCQPNLLGAPTRPIAGCIGPPASHIYGHSHALRTRPLEPGSPKLGSRTAESPPPLPLGLPLPALRHVLSDDTTPLLSNIHYKPYPNQPPSPTPQATLSPRLKHKLVLSPPTQRKQQASQRQILQQLQYKPPDSHSFLHHQQQHEINEQLRHKQAAYILQRKEERFHCKQPSHMPTSASKTQETHMWDDQEPVSHKVYRQKNNSTMIDKYLQQQALNHKEHQQHKEQDQERKHHLHRFLLQGEPLRIDQTIAFYHSMKKNAHKISGRPEDAQNNNYLLTTESLSPSMFRKLTLHRPQNYPSGKTPNPPENFPYQLMTPSGLLQAVPMKEFKEQLQEELVSPKEPKSIKEQYEEYESKRNLVDKGYEEEHKRSRKVLTSKRLNQQSQSPLEICRRPCYPPPQEPRTHHRRPPPPAPLNLRSPPAPRSTRDLFSPNSNPLSTSQDWADPQQHKARAVLFSPPPSSSSTRMFSSPSPDHIRLKYPMSKVYQPTAMSEMLLRGSPTPSVPSDFLRHRQDASPTPSQSSAHSEQVSGSVSIGRGKRSRGLNLFLKQQNRMAMLDAKVQDDDVGEECKGPQTHHPPFQHTSTFDEADLQRNGRVGTRACQESYGRGYYTVGRPSNLAFSSRSKSLQSSPTTAFHEGAPYYRGRERSTGGAALAYENTVFSPKRIPITVHHEPSSHTLPRLSRFNSEGSQSIHNQARRYQCSEDLLSQQNQKQVIQNQHQQKQPQLQQQQHQSPIQRKPNNQRESNSSSNIPILPTRTQRFSEEETTSSSQFPPLEGAPSKLSSSWQRPGALQHSRRDPSLCDTLPSKISQQRAYNQQQGYFLPRLEQTFFDSESGSRNQSVKSISLPTETYATLPTIKPLKSSSTTSNLGNPGLVRDLPYSHNILPLKTSQSSFEFVDLRDLEHTLDDTKSMQDFTKPLWANTDVDRRSSQRSSASSISVGEDGQSPYSDNAVSSSDSRDTIIAKAESASELFQHPGDVNNSFAQILPAQQDVQFAHERLPKPLSRQQDQQEVGPMECSHKYRGIQTALSRDYRPQQRLGPPTSPKPGFRIPVTVVHEQSSHAALRHLNSDVKGADGHEAFSHDLSTPHPFSQQSDYKQYGPAAHEFHGISFAPSKPGNWCTQTLPSRVKIEGRESMSSTTDGSLKNIAPVWKPTGTGPSSLTKKEYKPVRLDTSKKRVQTEEEKCHPNQEDRSSSRPQPHGAPSSVTPPTGEPMSFPTLPPSSLNTSTDSVFSSSSHGLPPAPPPAALSTSSTSSSLWATATDYTDPQSDSTLVSSVVLPSHHMNGGERAREDLQGEAEDSRLPPTQSPYITLLQKSRDPEDNEDVLNAKFLHKPIVVKDDGQLPKGATYIGSHHKLEDNRSVTEDYYTTSKSAPASDTSSRIEEHKPVKYEGIGPLDKEGVPLANRKNVTEENQKQWYKQMYKSLHRTEKKETADVHDNSSEVIYYDLMPEEKNTYKLTYTFPDDISDTKSEEGLDVGGYSRPSDGKLKSKADDSGYRSEPEGRHKDIMTFRSKSVSSYSQNGRRNWNPPNVRSKIEVYRCQPRSIMDYEPGFSSIAFRESKSHWRPRSKSVTSPRAREKQEKPHNPPIDKPGDFSQ